MVNAEIAVPPMPVPKIPRARPRRAGGYQALTNGTPIANVVPPRPRKKPPTRYLGVRVGQVAEVEDRQDRESATEWEHHPGADPVGEAPTGIRPSEPDDHRDRDQQGLLERGEREFLAQVAPSGESNAQAQKVTRTHASPGPASTRWADRRAAGAAARPGMPPIETSTSILAPRVARLYVALQASRFHGAKGLGQSTSRLRDGRGGVVVAQTGDRQIETPTETDGPTTDALLKTGSASSLGAKRRPTCGRCSATAGGKAMSSIATAGATTRSCGRRTGSTAPARARGRSTSRTGSSPGRASRPTTRRWARTRRSTSRAAARAARRSPGTPTRPPGSATRTRGACWWRCTGRRRPGSATRCAAWADVVGDPQRRRIYQQARGKGGHVRVSWDEAVEMIAAAHVHTIKSYGPDRVAGFSPIPAMSMVSHAVGSRFIELIGGCMTSFYDWYADLPVASPQVFGDQTDVPESGDWWNATYLLMWGSNVPVTRTPDAHWMAEARYKGQKVVVVSPGLRRQHQVRRRLAARPARHRRRAGHGDGPRDPQGVLRRPAGAVLRRLRPAVHRPAVPGHAGGARRRLRPRQVPHRRRPRRRRRGRGVEDRADRRPHRRAGRAQRVAGLPLHRRRLGRGTSISATSRRGSRCCSATTPRPVEVLLPRFDATDGTAGVLRRGVPVRRVGGRLVTTVFDLMLAQYGVRRDGLPGEWPTGYDDATQPYTPAWQESITRCRRSRRSGSRGRWPATPSSPAAAP